MSEVSTEHWALIALGIFRLALEFGGSMKRPHDRNRARPPFQRDDSLEDQSEFVGVVKDSRRWSATPPASPFGGVSYTLSLALEARNHKLDWGIAGNEYAM